MKFAKSELCPKYVYVHAKSLQPCPTLGDPMDCSPPGSSAHGILQGKNTGVGCHGALPDTGFEPASLISPALAERFFTISTTWEVLSGVVLSYTKPDLCPSWKDKSGDACLTFHNHCGKISSLGLTPDIWQQKVTLIHVHSCCLNFDQCVWKK